MKTLFKPSLIELRSFPFTCTTSCGVDENFRSLHWHREMEVCYVKQGTGKYLINGKEYPFAPGDLFIINNDEIHLCHDDRNLVMLVIMFDPALLWSGGSNPLDFEYLRPFFETESSLCNRLDGAAACSGLIADVLAEIEKEYSLRLKGFELMTKSLMLKFMTLIIRHFSSDISGAPLDNLRPSAPESMVSRRAAQKVKEIISYIETHYTISLTLSDLAQAGQMSVPYLSSTFKALAGISPMDFVIRRRISQAKLDLTCTDKSILSISSDCGFSSLSNFNHLFKAYVGMSPRAYRKS